MEADPDVDTRPRVAYLYLPDAGIDNNQLSADPGQNRGRVTGEYKSNVWILGVQYSASF